MPNVDQISKERAKQLFGSREIESFEVGTTRGLQQIHTYLFVELYDFTGQIRAKDISKGGFRFASCLYLKESLKKNEENAEKYFEENLGKNVKNNCSQPFYGGNWRGIENLVKFVFEKKTQA